MQKFMLKYWAVLVQIRSIHESDLTGVKINITDSSTAISMEVNTYILIKM